MYPLISRHGEIPGIPINNTFFFFRTECNKHCELGKERKKNHEIKQNVKGRNPVALRLVWCFYSKRRIR